MNRAPAPFFSVIVPIYNNEKDIEKCILSVLAQTYREFEVILVDDGSTDKSPVICDEFAKRDSRIQVIHRKKNGGAAAARNDGLFYACGKYIYYVDGDDWIAEKLLKKAWEKLGEDESVDIFAFCYVKVLENDRYVKRDLKVREGMYGKEKLIKEIYPNMICKIGRTIENGIDSGSLCDKIIKRELMMKHYCRNVSIFRGEDSVCAWECLYCADKIYFSKEPMYFYNQLSTSSGQKKYHPDLYENNKAIVAYLRVHLHAEKDFQIRRQINALEFRGMVGVIHQEIDYFHFCSSAKFLREKCKNESDVCQGIGLPFSVQLYILLINQRCFVILLLCVFIRYCFNFVFRMFRNLLRLYDNDCIFCKR